VLSLNYILIIFENSFYSGCLVIINGNPPLQALLNLFFQRLPTPFPIRVEKLKNHMKNLFRLKTSGANIDLKHNKAKISISYSPPSKIKKN